MLSTMQVVFVLLSMASVSVSITCYNGKGSTASPIPCPQPLNFCFNMSASGLRSRYGCADEGDCQLYAGGTNSCHRDQFGVKSCCCPSDKCNKTPKLESMEEAVVPFVLALIKNDK